MRQGSVKYALDSDFLRFLAHIAIFIVSMINYWMLISLEEYIFINLAEMQLVIVPEFICTQTKQPWKTKKGQKGQRID